MAGDVRDDGGLDAKPEPMTEAQGDQLLTELAAIRNMLIFLCAVAGLIAGKVIFWPR